MKNYYQGNSTHPQHVSVGAVLINGEEQICCHHFNSKKSDFKGYWKDQGLDDFYILMRETLELRETLESALHRGLMEEFGALGEIIDYIGSIQSRFVSKEVEIQKTTLYFLCKLKSQDLSQRSKGDVEFESDIEWQSKEFLIPKMKEQAEKFGRTDIDESLILERLQNHKSQT
jgi:NADH pyrophosphatase NudC (nudix superfamily)